MQQSKIHSQFDCVRQRLSHKKTLEIEKSERKSMWHKYVKTAILNHITSCHTSVECELSRVFNGSNPYNVLDFKFGLSQQEQPISISESVLDGLA